MHRVHNGTRFLYYVAGGIKGHPKVVLEYVTVQYFSIMCVHNNL